MLFAIESGGTTHQVCRAAYCRPELVESFTERTQTLLKSKLNSHGPDSPLNALSFVRSST